MSARLVNDRRTYRIIGDLCYIAEVGQRCKRWGPGSGNADRARGVRYQGFGDLRGVTAHCSKGAEVALSHSTQSQAVSELHAWTMNGRRLTTQGSQQRALLRLQKVLCRLTSVG